MVKKSLWVLAALVLAASAFGDQNDTSGSNLSNANTNPTKANGGDEIIGTIKQSDHLWVKMRDGGIACDKTVTAKTVEQGAEPLNQAKIEVFGSLHHSDGKMHSMMCGIPSGNYNFYQISKKDLKKAKKLGFTLASDPKSPENGKAVDDQVKHDPNSSEKPGTN